MQDSAIIINSHHLHLKQTKNLKRDLPVSAKSKKLPKFVVYKRRQNGRPNLKNNVLKASHLHLEIDWQKLTLF